MNGKIKTIIDSYFYGGMIAGMFCWLYTIGIARTSNWIVIMNFNSFNEGYIEFIFLFVWLLTFIYKVTESIYYKLYIPR